MRNTRNDLVIAGSLHPACGQKTAHLVESMRSISKIAHKKKSVNE